MESEESEGKRGATFRDGDETGGEERRLWLHFQPARQPTCVPSGESDERSCSRMKDRPHTSLINRGT